MVDKNDDKQWTKWIDKKRERGDIECEKSWEKEGFEIKLKPIDKKIDLTTSQ